MTPPPERSEWFTPTAVFGAIGMLGTIGAFWVSFDGRIRDTESASKYNRALITEQKQDLREIQAKLDRLIERRP